MHYHNQNDKTYNSNNAQEYCNIGDICSSLEKRTTQIEIKSCDENKELAIKKLQEMVASYKHGQ
ncbi:hypothetical protein JCM17961_39590 [Endothiovibrio diazotrophicus]